MRTPTQASGQRRRQLPSGTAHALARHAARRPPGGRAVPCSARPSECASTLVAPEGLPSRNVGRVLRPRPVAALVYEWSDPTCLVTAEAPVSTHAEQRRLSHRDDDNDHRRDDQPRHERHCDAERVAEQRRRVDRCERAASARKCSGDDRLAKVIGSARGRMEQRAVNELVAMSPTPISAPRMAPIAAAQRATTKPVQPARSATVVAGPCRCESLGQPLVSGESAWDARSGIIGETAARTATAPLVLRARRAVGGADDAGFATGASRRGGVGAVACDASGSCRASRPCRCRGALAGVADIRGVGSLGGAAVGASVGFTASTAGFFGVAAVFLAAPVACFFAAAAGWLVPPSLQPPCATATARAASVGHRRARVRSADASLATRRFLPVRTARVSRS